tara:strand:- start:799 stop:2970 length:2172 start_codon:yes stop_codon:yes gene_type:complete
MPLTRINIRPGFNKQVTETGAEGQWTDGDNVRFRYGLPEKIGGWEQITSSTLVGAARDQHIWADLEGRSYAAIGTHKALFVYYGGVMYDITPLSTAVTGATFTIASTSAPQTITVNKASHGLVAGDLFTFTSVTPPTGSGYTAAQLEANPFEVLSSSTNTFTIQFASAASGVTSATGSATINPYVGFGPLTQSFGYGWGTGLFGGTIAGALTFTLNGAISATTGGNNGSSTNITLNSTTGLPATGTVLIGSELITYSSISSNDIVIASRGALGTTAATHSNSATVTNASNFIGWNQATTSSTVVLDPASWSLDNFGQQLIATNKNGNTFSWNPIAANTNALNTRAAVITGAPTSTVQAIVSERDRHLIMLGTETTIGDTTTQDKLFIRFSDQETTNTYTPTSTNTAGTFRLDSGTKIVGAAKGKDYILIITDNAAYIMQFVGPPFTFSIKQVGSNCGAIGQHAIAFVNGAVFWMGQSGGFFMFDGTVKSLPCLVEDFVFTKGGNNLGINYTAGEIIYAGVNNLYSEINWFYAKDGSTEIDRIVTYNYDENVWTTGSLARTTYADATLFELPYATEFSASGTPNFPTINGVTSANGATTYFAHEEGTNEVAASGTSTAIVSFIQSGDFDLDVEGNGQFFMSMRRFVPDFKVLTGDAKISILLKDFPVDSEVSSPLGPFTISSATKKVDTRARARFASLKVENTSTNQSWRYGTFRADTQPDGMR